MMKNIGQIYDDFANILSNEELESLAEKYGTVDKRIRRLPIRIFFWLMVLLACIPTSRGRLPEERTVGKTNLFFAFGHFKMQKTVAAEMQAKVR